MCVPSMASKHCGIKNRFKESVTESFTAFSVMGSLAQMNSYCSPHSSDSYGIHARERPKAFAVFLSRPSSEK